MGTGPCGGKRFVCHRLPVLFAAALMAVPGFCQQLEQGQAEAMRVVSRRQVASGQAAPSAIVQTAMHTLARPNERGRIQLLAMVHLADERFYHRLEPVLQRADIILYESMKDADGDGAEAPREIDMLSGQILENTARLTGLGQQRAWERSLRKDDSRWRCIDLPLSQFYAHLDEHPVDLRPSVLRFQLASLEAMERTDSQAAARFLRSQMLEGYEAMTPGNCCYTWLPPDQRRVVHEFIHVKRDANFLSQVSQTAKDNPEQSIAVLLGAQHIAPLKRSLESEFHFEAKSVCWFDAITIETDSNPSGRKPNASAGE